MRTVILAGLAVLQLGASPATVSEPAMMTFVQEPQCGVPEVNLRGLCTDVRTKDSSRYERKVNVAACITAEMAPEEVRRRNRGVWQTFRPTCSGSGVGSNGDIIKYAVISRTLDFVSLAANVWCMDVNDFDNPERQTPLDFTVSEMARSASARATLQPYYDELRRGGALTRAEAEALGPNYPRMRAECRQ